jgi:methyl-accepting chemotaxis protein
MGIRNRFLIMMGILSLLALIAMGWASYSFNKHAAIKEAENKGIIIHNYLASQRQFFGEDQNPLITELVEQDRFYPYLMSGFAASRRTFEYFNKKMPGFMIKYAATNPLLLSNKADTDEVKIISNFKANPSQKVSSDTITKNGISFYYHAIPLKVDNARCLTCHGDPEDAPKDQVEIYGTENGYHWKDGDIVASLVVYIPIAGAIADAKKTAFKLLGLGAGGLLLTMFVVSIFLEKGIVLPIMTLNDRTEEISLGKNLDQPVSINSNDEIATLARGIDRLRISVARMLKR